MLLTQKLIPSPVGELRLVAGESALVHVFFPMHRRARLPVAVDAERHAVLDQAADELNEYFRGDRTTFSVALAPSGTPFQRAVWALLADIPFAERCSYAEIASRLGRPEAGRAVGAAVGRNPLAIFIPCHRVVAKSGALTGFAGGLDVKQWLLTHERENIAVPSESSQTAPRRSVI